MNIHSGAAVCWICLEGGPDDLGKAIARDCACRGNDASFAHTNCVIKYAQKKSEQANTLDEFIITWEKCPICHQDYKNDLAIQIANAFVSFAEGTYGRPGNSLVDKMRVMEALRLQIQSYFGNFPRWRGDEKQLVENLTHRLLELVDRAKDEHDMKGWVHMAPTSEKFQNYRHFRSRYEAYGYVFFGQLHFWDERKKSKDIEIGHYKKARDIFKSVGMEKDEKKMSDLIDQARALCEGDAVGHLACTKKMYNNALRDCGENSEQTIEVGVSYASGLRLANFSIEAERLVMKLAANSRQVYGNEHQCSKISVRLLNDCRRRFVHHSSTELGGNAFQALRYQALHYENDGEDCIISGPVIPGFEFFVDYDEWPVATSSIFPAIGCPVICHGLVNASHLNGKLGEVRSISVKSGDLRLGVHFEDKSLKSAAVKPGNLRIAFVLPRVELSE